ncbi:MAG: glycosyltransferase WbuB [Chloroflexi bacterium]|nr:MAG: glycosyltransferase WbuB [Chloroflexota bacterium]
MAEGLRLLVVQETDWLQRGPHQQHHLFERLSLRGHTVVAVDFEMLYTPWPKAPLLARRAEWQGVARALSAAHVRVVRPPTLRLPGIARLVSVGTFHRELQRLAAQLQPQVLVNYALSTGLPALALARRRQIPMLMHVIDALHTLVPVRSARWIARQVERYLLRNAHHTLYINQTLQDYGVALGAASTRASTIRTGVDLQRFHPRNDAGEVRRAYGFAADDVVLVFTGWLYEFSGLDAVMRAMQQLPANVRLLIVGTGSAEQRLRALQQSLGLGARVVFAGQQPYSLMPAVLAAADVCLLHSEVNAVTRHIVPIKVYEYMASGKPVLAAQLPGLEREVPPGNGILYAPPAGLQATLQKLLDPAVRAAAGRQARSFTEKYCDWEALTGEFEALLQRLAGSAA